MPRLTPPTGPTRTDRSYRRLGASYLLLLPAIILTTGTIVISIGSLVGVLILDLPGGEYFEIFGWTGLGMLVWVGSFLVWGPRMMRPVVEWVRGDRDPERAAVVWHSATGGTGRLFLTGVLVFMVCEIPAVVHVEQAAELPWYGTPLVVVGIQLFVAGAAFVNYFALELLLRPILREVSEMLPRNFEVPRRGATLTVKILGASVVITAFAGILLIAATNRVDEPLALLATGIGILIFVSLTLALPLSALLARSVVSPVQRLVGASRDVREGNLMTGVPLTSSDELGLLSQSFNDMVAGLREREALRSAMGAYVDPVVAQRVIEEGHVLEGVETQATIMFLDFRDFTARSERMSAGEVVAFLNELFGVLVPVIDEHGGHVNKFLGDGLLAVFGAPEPLADHAARAVDAARAAVRRIRKSDGSVRIGIGLNSGPVVVGTVGGGAHLEYGLIGDTVNVAARIEELTKETGDEILVSETTRRLVRGLRTASRGTVELRGRSDPVRVFAVQAGRSPTRTSARRPGRTRTPRPAGTPSPRG